ncbi:hypothetical protein A0J48_026475, partial [Sphaerospermopsis aphanizomenoides BCCUSP55]|uniref:Calx-beta domain-containing protein n=1 Tax=Sphaerospermopsis aphanizomenoides TaxID=459663 RepID=UPI002D8002A2
LPTITLAVSPSSVTENGTTNLVYTFTRTGSTTSALTVNYSIAGTAASTDYTGATPGTGKTITFAAGSSTATLVIDPTGDTIGEFNETVALTLATGTGYTVGTTTAVTGTITNDDALFSSSFDLVLLQDLSGSFSDDIATVQTLVPSLITGVNSLQPNTPIGISSFIDKPISPFGGSSFTDYVYQTHQALTTDSSLIQTIYNGLNIGDGNDFPEAQLEALLQVAVRPTEIGFRTGTKRVVVLFTDAAYHVAGDGAAAGITTPNNLDAILDGTPAGTGEDYPGISSLKQSLINASILPIFAVTSDQISTYQSLLSQLGVGGSVVQLSSDSSNIVNAIREGLSNLFLANINAPTSGLITTETGTSNSFTVTLSTQPTANVTIGLQVSDSTEGILSTNSLVFTPTNWNVAQTVTVTGRDDPEGANLQDGDQTYQIITAPLVSTDVNYNGVNPIDVTVVNRDGDLPTITLAVSPSSVTENGTTNLVYTFTRTGSTTNALTVNYSIAGTAASTDYTGATPGTGKTITFAAGSSTATLTIDPTGDTTVESDETVALTLATGTGYTVGTTTAVTGTITNDDVALPTITLAVSPSSVTENGTTNLVYTFTRTGSTTSALTVNYSIA